MSLDLALTIALDVAFLALFIFTLVEYLRHRERVRLIVVLVFASVAVVLLSTPLRALLPVLTPVLTFLVLPALLAHPLLVLYLSSFVRPMPRLVLRAALAGFVGLSGALVAILAMGALGGTAAGADRGSLIPIVLLVLIGYFLALEAGAAVTFARAARERAGASRTRLAIAAGATALFGAALVLLLLSSLINQPNTEAAQLTNVVVRVVAFLSAFGYLAAFAPPRGLRRFSQQSIAYDFIRDLNALPSGSDVQQIWDLLTSTVRRASGADVQLVERGPSTAPARSGLRTVAVPFDSLRWPDGRLELGLPQHVLFLEDDLELTALLVDRAVRAAEREAFIVEREELITGLQAASAAKSDFLAAMSHELRTPLNAIIGFSELLKEGGEDAADPSTVTAYSEHIHGSGLHLLELVNDVLDLARVEAGRLDLKPVDLELDALVRATVGTVKPLAADKGQTISVDLAPVMIEADPSRLRQIVLNLLSNAIKFTPAGGTIRLSLTAADDGAVTLSVADTGRGIAAADLERIFEAFQQAEGEGPTPHHEGTGLGLALTRQLVEAHGGSIDVRSEVGVGSEFRVVLPARREVPAQAGPPLVVSDRPSVLIIEDDLAAQELLRHHLEGAGYAVIATTSGRQGLAWMREVRPDAVLLDILLPDIDGWEILQRAKGDPETRSIPIMVVSVVDDKQLGLALGAVDYCVKPVSRERLLEALGRLTFTTKVKTRSVTALVIDADPAAAKQYRELLEPEGFHVIEATDGAAGLRRAAADRPDLILLDALLPDIDGFELASQLHRDPATATIPIWLTTPAGLPPEAKVRLNGTVQGVLSKGDDALAAMRVWLEAPRRPAASGEVPA